MACDLCYGIICAAHADCSIAQIKWARMTEKSKVDVAAAAAADAHVRVMTLCVCFQNIGRLVKSLGGKSATQVSAAAAATAQ